MFLRPSPSSPHGENPSPFGEGRNITMDEIKHDIEDFEVWLEYGIISGFCGPIVCADHDGIPMTIVEEETYERDGEQCLPIVRIYQSLAVAKGVIANHPPTSWRGTRFQ